MLKETTRENKIFEIGLVMAGAGSAGAYTAGVIDYLIQALDEWQKAKEDGRTDCPQHDVKIKVISGASAGGMIGAIMTALLNDTFSSITTLPENEPDESVMSKNKLYDSWVEKIDITKLLTSQDLEKKKTPVKSILDSTVLDEIANSAITFTPCGSKRKYISENLHIFLALTNLRGVPYDIDFKGGTGEGHGLSQHADYMHFILSEQETDDEGALWLNPKDAKHESWNILKQAALATGAFPISLAPRQLFRNSEDYDKRKWLIPQEPRVIDGKCRVVNMKVIKPQWPDEFIEKGRSFEYRYLCVDGGVMNNEPFEYAHRVLMGDDSFNPRNPKDVCRTILMIDPFPGVDSMTEKEVEEFANYDIIKVVMRLFSSLLQQVGFKMDELKLAQTPNVYSRFLIAPTRSAGNNKKYKYPIASSVMGNFGGFLSKRFRKHDFQLGRRNCQKFLKDHFVIPLEDAKKNPVFAGKDASELDKYKVTINEKDYFRIIPVLAEADNQVNSISWNELKLTDLEFSNLKNQVLKRIKKIINRLIDQHIEGFPKYIARFIVWMKRRYILDKIIKKIKDDLGRFGLI